MSAWMTQYRITRDHKTWLRGYLHDLAADARQHDPETLAAQLLTLHECATVLYSVGADPTAPQTAREAAATLLAHDGRVT